MFEYRAKIQARVADFESTLTTAILNFYAETLGTRLAEAIRFRNSVSFERLPQRKLVSNEN